MSLAHREAKAILDVKDVVLGSTFTEGDNWFVEVDLLTGGLFIHSEAIFDKIAVPFIGFEENKAIISKEQVGDHGAAPGYSDAL